MQCYRIC